MKTCPMLWRQSEIPGGSLLEKRVELDTAADAPAAVDAAHGLNLECLGPACRFCDEGGACLLERIGRLVTGEEIAEGLNLATAALTDETRAALDCTAGRLTALEEQLAGLAAATGGAAGTDAVADLARDLAAWREGVDGRFGELSVGLGATTTALASGVSDLRADLATERSARETAAGAAGAWQQGLGRRLDDMEERWENMVLSLTELTERIESAVGVIHQHIEIETAERRRQEQEAKLAAAKRENNAGVSFYHARDLERARACFREATAIAPDFVEAHNNLGLVETELGDAEAATRHFQRAIELDPGLSASYNNLGYVFFLQQNYEEAIAMYEEAIERAANGSAAWTNLGNAHFKLGNLEKAREAWDKAVALDPGNRKAAENLARLLQTAPA